MRKKEGKEGGGGCVVYVCICMYMTPLLFVLYMK